MLTLLVTTLVVLGAVYAAWRFKVLSVLAAAGLAFAGYVWTATGNTGVLAMLMLYGGAVWLLWAIVRTATRKPAT